MNNTIKNELSKVKEADLSSYNEITHTYFIKKKISLKIEELKYYLVEVKDSVRSNTSLSSNWNNGKIPTERFYHVQVVQKMYNMIKVTGVSYDVDAQVTTGHFFDGWLPLKEINIIEEII